MLAERDTGITPQEWLDERDAVFNDLLRGFPMPVLTKVTADPDLDVTMDSLFEFGLARLLDGFAALLPRGDDDFRQAAQRP